MALQATHRKVSEKPPNKPRIKINLGAFRHTFEFTDDAVNLLLGTKYQPILFCLFVFKIKFLPAKHLPAFLLHSKWFIGLKVALIFFIFYFLHRIFISSTYLSWLSFYQQMKRCAVLSL